MGVEEGGGGQGCWGKVHGSQERLRIMGVSQRHSWLSRNHVALILLPFLIGSYMFTFAYGHTRRKEGRTRWWQ